MAGQVVGQVLGRCDVTGLHLVRVGWLIQQSTNLPDHKDFVWQLFFFPRLEILADAKITRQVQLQLSELAEPHLHLMMHLCLDYMTWNCFHLRVLSATGSPEGEGSALSLGAGGLQKILGFTCSEQALVQCTDSTFPLASGKQLVHVCSGPAKLRYQWIPDEVHEVLGLRQLFRTVQSIFQNLCHIQPCSAGGWKHVDSNVDSTSQSSHSKPATIKQCVH